MNLGKRVRTQLSEGYTGTRISKHLREYFAPEGGTETITK